MEKLKIYQNAEEYGALHNENCGVNIKEECDCENFKMVRAIIEETIKTTVEFLSYDMNFKNKEQRKVAVKMYLEN